MRQREQQIRKIRLKDEKRVKRKEKLRRIKHNSKHRLSKAKHKKKEGGDKDA